MNLRKPFTIGRYLHSPVREVVWYYANWTNARGLVFCQRKAVMAFRANEYPSDRTVRITWQAENFTLRGKYILNDWSIWQGKS